MIRWRCVAGAVAVIALSAASERVSAQECPSTLYVDAEAAEGGDGQSWATAFKFLQDALHVAATCDGGNGVAEVLVAGGVYYPDDSELLSISPGDRDASFWIDGVATIRGGYDGQSGEERTELTILSGAIAGQRDEFARTIVTVLPTWSGQLIERITIVDSFNDVGDGGGMLSLATDLRLCDVIVQRNTALSGGGVRAIGKNFTITGNSNVSANDATVGVGGGLWLGCDFVQILGASFAKNTAATRGGGIASEAAVVFSVRGTRFDYHRAPESAAVHLHSFGSAEFVNCTFTNSRRNEMGDPGASGGGVGLWEGEEAAIIRSSFIDLMADRGSLVDADGVQLVRMWGCAAYACQVGPSPNAGRLVSLVDIALADIRLSAIRATDAASAHVIYFSGETISVSNSIVRSDLGAAALTATGSVSVNYSNVEGYGGGGSGNFDVDPPWATNVDVNCGLSPMVNSGSNSLIPADLYDVDDDADLNESFPIDLVGSQRIRNGTIDIGAYECPG